MRLAGLNELVRRGLSEPFSPVQISDGRLDHGRKEDTRDMGAYVNPGNFDFEGCSTDELYVDKTGLIRLTNAAIGKPRKKRIVVSRPRRFGKTMALTMLSAYYSCGCDSKALFRGMTIAQDPSFEEHLNQHNIIILDVQGLYIQADADDRLDTFPQFISETVNTELEKLFPDEVHGNEDSLSKSILAIHAKHGTKFIFLLDEWDVIYREEKFNEKLKEDYTDFLMGLFKNDNMSECLDLVYMTGILPILKQATHSELDNFNADTMLNPLDFAEYVGFTEAEVEALCQKNQLQQEKLQDLKAWYRGYQFGSVGAMYCPFSITKAIDSKRIKSYWGKTGTTTELVNLMNATNPMFRRAAQDLLSVASVDITVDKEGIDLSDVGSLDTALTALVHLGYLVYQEEDGTVRIPNQEVAAEFLKAVKEAKKNPCYKIMARSKELQTKTLRGDAKAVSKMLQANHERYASVYSYDQENDLACVVITSYSAFAEQDYTFHRELHGGKGFADIVFLPRPGRPRNIIPIIVELSWKEDADTAVQQIKERRYTGLAHGYPSALLVGIRYGGDAKEKDYKNHTCVIEQVDNP